MYIHLYGRVQAIIGQVRVMRFPPSFLDQIRDRVPISEVVGRRVTWDKRKSQASRGDFWACCPFHEEKTPSFHADDRRGHYHCFGCGASGDHFRFLTEREGMSFPEAVETLARQAGLPMPERDPREEKREAERASLYDVMESAATFFEAQLRGPQGAKARAYLRERGLSPEIQARFRIGYAPPARNALKEHLAGAGIDAERMAEAGLLVTGDDIPVSYDRFRDRIIFPITDLRGRVIAFGGRALSADQPAKYINSPETPLFRKGEMLFNAANARAAAARQGGHVIAVEGYVDAIACAAAGFEATVAPLGTALTEDQLRLLWRMADEPILCFDGDEAGLKAAYRAIDMALPLLEPGKSVKFALLPEGQDPDDLLRAEGASAFRAVLENARPLVEMLWLRETEGVALDTPERQAGLEARLYALIAGIKNTDILRRYRAHVRLRLAQLFNPYEGRSQRGKATHSNVIPFKTRPNKGALEAIILGFCVEYPFLLADFVEEVCNLEFSKQKYKAFSEALHKLYIDYESIDVSLIYRKLGRDFYDVLEEIHGSERRRVIEVSVTRIVVEGSGHKLRLMFPLVRYNPTQSLVQATMSFLLLRLQLVNMEQMKPRDIVPPGADADTFDAAISAFVNQLNEMRRRVSEQEAELADSYDRLKASLSEAA
jgi:DNA primase catalytic core